MQEEILEMANRGVSMLAILVSGRRIPKLVSNFLFATMSSRILALQYCYSLGYSSTNAFLTAGSGLFEPPQAR
jgi:hypothetical protein